MYRNRMAPPVFTFKAIFLICLLLAFLAACKPGARTTAQTSPAPSSGQPPVQEVTNSATAIPTPLPPTQAPLAAIADGWEISLAEYQSELAQYKAARGTELAPEDEKRVLDDLIDQALLASAAEQNGFQMDEATLDERTRRLVDQLGGQAALDGWMQTYGYDQASFRQALKRSIASAWMRDQIVAGVPKSAEQVHARQILLYTADQADEVMGLLQAGNDFGNLAMQYDPLTRGDLGWFPRGYLLDKKLEEAAFSLQPEATSEVIETLAGYHILQVLERADQRPLTPEALLAQQVEAVKAWLEQRRSQTEIQILLS
jgi:parvulin-like peptidyl-prolyl isomerase